MTLDKTSDYLGACIYEAIGAYNAWKMILYSRSERVLPKHMAERYVEIQKYHAQFFQAAYSAFLFQFVIQILHVFDRNSQSASLYNLDKEETELFIKENSEVIETLKKLRDQVLAHRDIVAVENLDKFKIPSVNQLDEFFKRIESFYNQYTSKKYSHGFIFDEAWRMKDHIEHLFMNLYRGEAVRIREIDVEYMQSGDKRASDLI